MDNAKNYSIEAIAEFLRESGEKKMMKFNTVRTRLTALSRISEYLTPLEQADVREVDRDELVSRFRSKEPAISEGTILTYVTRLEQSMKDYAQGEQRLTRNVPKVRSFSVGVSERRETLVIPIRSELIRIVNLPNDLTLDDIDQICSVLKAYAGVGNGQ